MWLWSALFPRFDALIKTLLAAVTKKTGAQIVRRSLEEHFASDCCQCQRRGRCRGGKEHSRPRSLTSATTPKQASTSRPMVKAGVIDPTKVTRHSTSRTQPRSLAAPSAHYRGHGGGTPGVQGCGGTPAGGVLAGAVTARTTGQPRSNPRRVFVAHNKKGLQLRLGAFSASVLFRVADFQPGHSLLRSSNKLARASVQRSPSTGDDVARLSRSNEA